MGTKIEISNNKNNSLEKMISEMGVKMEDLLDNAIKKMIIAKDKEITEIGKKMDNLKNELENEKVEKVNIKNEVRNLKLAKEAFEKTKHSTKYETDDIREDLKNLQNIIKMEKCSHTELK